VIRFTLDSDGHLVDGSENTIPVELRSAQNRKG
jgi:hypothetical protein